MTEYKSLKYIILPPHTEDLSELTYEYKPYAYNGKQNFLGNFAGC